VCDFFGGNILPSLLCYFQIVVVESSLQFCTYIFFICVCNIILSCNNIEYIYIYITLLFSIKMTHSIIYPVPYEPLCCVFINSKVLWLVD